MQSYSLKAFKINIKLLVLVPIVLLASNTYGQNYRGRLDSLFSTRHKEGMFNGNILIAQGGHIVYQRAYGYANQEKKIFNRELSRSDLGSTSKLFTAVAVLQLKEKGQIRLEDAVVKYLPDFPFPAITIRHLLTHTSGLPDFQIFDAYYAEDPHRILKNNDVIPAIKRYGKVLFNPGEHWSYSSPGMALLASIVEKVSRTPFEKYLAIHIWEPAGMHHTYINSLSAPITDTNRVENYATDAYFSSSLYRADTMRRHRQFSQESGALLGPGLIVSDTKDLFLFDQALYTSILLKPTSLKEAFTPIRLNNGEYAHPEPWLGDTLFGLGWFILQDDYSGKIVLHTGKHAGIVTVFLRNITKRQTIVLFDNTESYGLNNTVLNALNILNDKPYILLKRSLAKLYSNELFQYGVDFAIGHFNQLKTDTANYYLNVQEMDYSGHQLLDNGHAMLGLETLKLLTLIDPANWFPYYSYGIALQQAGKTTEAIMALRKALTINPKEKDAINALKEILKH
jgi:CubicO group peptidase (beta-lactamase class C family)